MLVESVNNEIWRLVQADQGGRVTYGVWSKIEYQGNKIEAGFSSANANAAIKILVKPYKKQYYKVSRKDVVVSMGVDSVIKFKDAVEFFLYAIKINKVRFDEKKAKALGEQLVGDFGISDSSISDVIDEVFEENHWLRKESKRLTYRGYADRMFGGLK